MHADRLIESWWTPDRVRRSLYGYRGRIEQAQDSFLAAEEVVDIDRAIESLPGRARLIADLHWRQGDDPTTIAKEHRMQENSVWRSLMRSCVKVEKLLCQDVQ